MSAVTRFDDWLCNDEPTWVPEDEVVATCWKCPLPYEDHIITVNAEFGYDEVTCPQDMP